MLPIFKNFSSGPLRSPSVPVCASIRCMVVLLPLLAFGGIMLAARGEPASAKLPSAALVSAGAAKVDITPEYPIRLSGYGARTKQSDGIGQRLWAKALAFGKTQEDTAVLVTVDNVGVPGTVTEEVYNRVSKKQPFPRANFTLCSTHTHNGPMLTGVLPFLFSRDIEPAEQVTINRYTAELTDRLEQVVLNALQDRKPAVLTCGEGHAGFARNRRSQGGPVDQSLPVLAVHSPDGALRAVLANYACHCTALASNLHGGDWAGFAQESMEREYPGCIAMVSIGCGADANPNPMGSLQAAQDHGLEIATEVSRLLASPLRPLPQAPVGAMSRFELPFDSLPERAQWEALAQKPGITGYHARKNLERLDRGETLPAALPYSVQTWNFGNDLAMIFLPGEVVVDYSLGLKREYENLWVTAYANDVPCYIPSSRILKEGGYEGGSAMPYYDRPARLGPDTENRIFSEVRKLLPDSLRLKIKEGISLPVAAEESLKQITVKPGFTVSLVAAEPEIVDPVAIDFGADGKLWVVEMRDYPLGMDGNGKPGGRVKFLEDTNGDGRYEKATVFLDALPFPTGLLTWRKGVLITAAPDILYAEDTDGDGQADKVEKLYSGFATENFQARVNGLRRGLDGWVYGANGLLGGSIKSSQTGKTVDIRGRDFRLNPDNAEFEPASGLTQQGRVRDDWDQWFGSDNSTFAWYYPMPEHYLKRNAVVIPLEQRLRVELSRRVFPKSPTLERFNDLQDANSATAACGGDFYRDNLLGDDFYGNYFVNESVHNLTTRLELTKDGISFRGRRPADEEESEFFASSDNSSRPVQVRTGPDGALWIVDMYRSVIEHPKWIAAEQLAKLDVRAGDDKGRIFRVFPAGKTLRPVRDLTKLSPPELVAVLNTANGPVRDLVQDQLVRRGDPSITASLTELAAKSTLPQVRLQALATLEGLRLLKPEALELALSDAHPGVRSNAVRMSEPYFSTTPALAAKAATLVEDPEAAVRYQLALSLGEWNDPRAGEALGKLALKDMGGSWTRTAILSSSVPQAAEVLDAVLASPPETKGRSDLIGGLISTAIDSGNQAAAARVLEALASVGNGTGSDEVWRFTAWANLIHALERRRLKLEDLIAGSVSGDSTLTAKLEGVFQQAGALAFEEGAEPERRQAALRLYGFSPSLTEDGLRRLLSFFDSGAEPGLRDTALQALRRNESPALAALVLRDWTLRSPAARSTFVDLLLSRETWTGALLTALEQGTVSGAEIAVQNRDRFLKNTDPAIGKRAEKVFASFQPNRRSEVLAAYKETASLTGNAARGAQIFKVSCGICHTLRGIGQAVGPDISLFRDKPVPEFLEAILDPNAVIEPRFLNYVAELKDGRFAAGIITSETANSLTLAMAAGQRQVLLRPEIKEIRPSPVSLMPEGFEQSITPPQMADLIAFLKGGTPREFGSSTAESAAAARVAFSPAQSNGAAKITAASTIFDYTSWLGLLPFAHCHQTDGTAKVVWETAPAPQELQAGECQTFLFPGGLGHHRQPAGIFELKVNGTDALEFGVELGDHTWVNADATVHLSYEVKEAGREDSNGIFSLTLASSLLEPGKPVVLEVTGSAANSNRWFGIYALTPGTLALSSTASSPPADGWLMDPATADAQRLALIRQYPARSAEFLRELIADLKPGTPEEYRRIPWIWNVAIAAARRGEAGEILELLEISLPKPGEPLHDWQSVVLGGGLINGISQTGPWPGPRLMEIMGQDQALLDRWNRSLELAVLMADNEKVPHATRYDALRMTPLLPWEKSGAQLNRYLAKDQNAELQQGAVSGLADVNHPEAGRLLVEALEGLTDSNKNFALDALLRSPERIDLLLETVAAKKITRQVLGDVRVGKLLSLEDLTLREKFKTLLTPH
ncbi:MAG: neutral/alkaline non-lysosomal ceramidase N-terminal domain-containing protein [Verrucomicrobiota bacterium]